VSSTALSNTACPLGQLAQVLDGRQQCQEHGPAWPQINQSPGSPLPGLVVVKGRDTFSALSKSAWYSFFSHIPSKHTAG